jgi:hypothetical protein
MTRDLDPAELVDCQADERLLGEDLQNVPEALGRPETIAPSRSRRRVVGIGATLTGVTLIAGIALLLLGAIAGVSSGFGLTDAVEVVLGVVLVGTHWGWVHVAEWSANAMEGRVHRDLIDDQRRWLVAVEPYPRWEVSTTAEDDGTITILTTRHRPVGRGERWFTFVREIVARERHSADEPAADVTERAELLRRAAAADTRQARDAYEAAKDAYDRAVLAHDDERERLAAAHAASKALSDRINSNLRNPPLVE